MSGGAGMVSFFFVRDGRRDMRFFSSEPPKPPEAGRSKAKEAWELAKRKLMVLPQRMLRQEQAFARALRLEEPGIRVFYSGIADEHKIHHRFNFFLQRQRSKRVFYLIGEALLVPLAGLLTPLPGPNVAFYAVALLIITHWLSVRGVRAILKKKHEFVAAPLLAEWEAAVADKAEGRYADILGRIEAEFGLVNLRKVLWR
jgi:hypothetical protein